MNNSQRRIVALEHAYVREINYDWPLARKAKDEIDHHWLRRLAQKPSIFNGTIFLLQRWLISGDEFIGECFRTDFKNFLWWREHNRPDREVFDFFAVAALHSREGHLLVGTMGPNTVSAGAVYMPCGSIHSDDIADGKIDLDRSLIRETAEETGIFLSREELGPPILIFDGARIVYLRPIQLKQSGSELVRDVSEFINRGHEPELANVRLIRDERDLNPDSMPQFVLDYVRYEKQLSSRIQSRPLPNSK